MKPGSPIHQTAVGLVYRERIGETPCVSVKGSAAEADEVVKIARRFGIPVVENPNLARSLSTLEIDSEIPASLFRAVAILLSHLDTPKKRP